MLGMISIEPSQKLVSEAEKAAQTTSVCDMSLIKIVTQLHLKALSQVKGDFRLQNSAITGDDEKTARFFGAGKHLIAVFKKATDKDSLLTPNEALQPIKEYVTWFCGPDIANGLTETSLVAMQADETPAKVKADESLDEIRFRSFSQYLAESILNEETPAPKAPGEDEEEPADKTDSTEEKTEDTDGTQSDDSDAKGDLDAEVGAKAKGWYVSYKLVIDGAKEKPFTDNMKNLYDGVKKFLGDQINSIGIAGFNWRSGSVGDATTLGDQKDKFSEMFGSINPDDLRQNYREELEKKWPSNELDAEVYDTQSVEVHLKKHLSGSDKQKLKSAEYALCTRVKKTDPRYKQYNVNDIADLVNKSIKGLVKKLRHSIAPADVIFVNNYDPDKADSDYDEKISGERKTGQVVDSKSAQQGTLIVEENDEISQSEDSTKKIDADLNAETVKIMTGGKTGLTKKAYTYYGSYESTEAYLSAKGIFDASVFKKDTDETYAVVVLMKPKTKVWNDGENPKTKQTPGYGNFNDSVVKSMMAKVVGVEPASFTKYEKTANDSFHYYNKGKTPHTPADCEIYVGAFSQSASEEPSSGDGQPQAPDQPSDALSQSTSTDQTKMTDAEIATLAKEFENLCQNKLKDSDGITHQYGCSSMDDINSRLAKETYTPNKFEMTQYTHGLWVIVRDESMKADESLSTVEYSLMSKLFEGYLTEKDAKASAQDKLALAKGVFKDIQTSRKSIDWSKKIETAVSKSQKSTIFVLPFSTRQMVNINDNGKTTDYDFYIVPMKGLKHRDKTGQQK